MSDYISRQDAVNTLWKEPSYTDPLNVLAEARDRIKSLEPADVAPVVRCKDCKFYTSMRPDLKTGICDLNVHHMGDDGFCSCGERRKEEA